MARRFIYFNFDRTESAHCALLLFFVYILEINFCNHFSCLLRHVFQLTIPQSDRVHLPAIQRYILILFLVCRSHIPSTTTVIFNLLFFVSYDDLILYSGSVIECGFYTPLHLHLKCLTLDASFVVSIYSYIDCLDQHFAISFLSILNRN